MTLPPASSGGDRHDSSPVEAGDALPPLPYLRCLPSPSEASSIPSPTSTGAASLRPHLSPSAPPSPFDGGGGGLWRRAPCSPTSATVGMAFGRRIEWRQPSSPSPARRHLPPFANTHPVRRPQTWRPTTRLGPTAELLPARSLAPLDPEEAELELGLGGYDNSRLDKDLDTPIRRDGSGGHSSSSDCELLRRRLPLRALRRRLRAPPLPLSTLPRCRLLCCAPQGGWRAGPCACGAIPHVSSWCIRGPAPGVGDSGRRGGVASRSQYAGAGFPLKAYCSSYAVSM